MDWDDLRYIMAVYDNNSVLLASQKLGVNASTVHRRVVKFEQQNNIRLFERSTSGYTPTKECEVLAAASREMVECVNRIKLEVLGQDLRLDGTLNVTSTDSIVSNFVAPHLREFHALHPEITVNLTATHRSLDLAKQEADIAIRASLTPPEGLIRQQIAMMYFGIYATPESGASLTSKPSLKELCDQKWLGAGGSLEQSLSASWIRKNIPSKSCWLNLDTFPSMAACAAQSMGLAVLPCHIADPIPQLRQVHCPWFNLSLPIWALMHPKLENAARPRAFMEYITKTIKVRVGESSIQRQ